MSRGAGDYEVICGSSMHYAHEERGVNTVIDQLWNASGREASIAVDLQSRERQDLTAYERGKNFAQWLRAGYFTSQEDLARALHLSPSRVCRLLKLATLPEVIVAAFEKPLDLRESWGLELAELLEKPLQRKPMLQAARAIGALSPRPQAREIYKRLRFAANRGRRPQQPMHDRVIKNAQGMPLFRVRHLRNWIALLLPVAGTSATSLEVVQRMVADLLEVLADQSGSAPPVSRAGGAENLELHRASSQVTHS